MVKVGQLDRSVLAVEAERHRLLPSQPRYELLVGHQRVRACAGSDQNRPEVVDGLAILGRRRISDWRSGMPLTLIQGKFRRMLDTNSVSPRQAQTAALVNSRGGQEPALQLHLRLFDTGFKSVN